LPPYLLPPGGGASTHLQFDLGLPEFASREDAMLAFQSASMPVYHERAIPKGGPKARA